MVDESAMTHSEAVSSSSSVTDSPARRRADAVLTAEFGPKCRDRDDWLFGSDLSVMDLRPARGDCDVTSTEVVPTEEARDDHAVSGLSGSGSAPTA